MRVVGAGLAGAALLAVAAASARAEPAAFRVTALELRDPHVFLDSFVCGDITQTNVFGGPAFNARLYQALANDTDGNGFVDLGYAIVFDDADTTPGAAGTLRLGRVRCTAPASSAMCAPDPGVPLATLAYTNSTGGTCLAPLPGTTWDPYDPDVTVASHPCFVTDAADVTLDLLGLALPLTDMRVAALYVGAPLQLQTGLIRGFVSAAAAEGLVVPADWPQIGGLTLAALLPGGSDCCAAHSDVDTGPDGTTPGWWFHLNFIAEPVPFDEVPVTAGTPPRAAGLAPAYPNPFNPSVTIPFALGARERVRLTVHDVAGARVATLVAGERAAGTHAVRWDGRDRHGHPLASGVYLVRLETAATVYTRKIVLLK